MTAEEMREAANKVASRFSLNKTSIHPDLTWDQLPSSTQLIIHTTCQQVAEAISDIPIELERPSEREAELINAIGLLFIDAMSVRCDPSSYARRVIELVRSQPSEREASLVEALEIVTAILSSATFESPAGWFLTRVETVIEEANRALSAYRAKEGE